GQSPVARPPAAPAARAGGPTAEAAYEYRLYFDVGSAEVEGPSRRVLSQLIGDALLIQPERIVVIGYADSLGDAAYNAELSRRRARTVAFELARAGLPKESIVVRALGERQSAVAAKHGTARHEDRRVSVRLL
ncbi:MAG: OmpA family protein, partial [Geminicoccales bacterium]